MSKDERDNPFEEINEIIRKMMEDMGVEDFEWQMEGTPFEGMENMPNNITQNLSKQTQEDKILDLNEGEDKVTILLDTPGFEEEDLTVDLEEDTLIVDGVKNYLGKLHEEISISKDIKDITYEVNNGILEVVLEK